jgi:hypothetical protein
MTAGHQRNNNESYVGQITVPVGVKVIASYNQTCTKDARSLTIEGDGNTHTLASDEGTKSVFPYSFAVSLQKGYSCWSDGNVRTLNGHLPNVKHVKTESVVESDNIGGFTLSNKQMITAFALLGGVLLIAIVILLKGTGSTEHLLTVKQIMKAANSEDDLPSLPPLPPEHNLKVAPRSSTQNHVVSPKSVEESPTAA